MKLILENWRNFLTEGEEIFGYEIGPNDKVFLSPEKFLGMRNIDAYDQKIGRKPRGLWYGCGDEWLSFIRSEFGPEYEQSIKHIYKIDLNYATLSRYRGDSVLRISTADELRDFDGMYTVRPSKGGSTRRDILGTKMEMIDWHKVATEYSGIEICPYLGYQPWSGDVNFRMGLDWYYTWDVASGCIWNEKAIRNIELISSKENNSED